MKMDYFLTVWEWGLTRIVRLLSTQKRRAFVYVVVAVGTFVVDGVVVVVCCCCW